MSERYYKQSPDVSTRLLGDERAVLFHPDTNRERFLNPSALFIWRRLASPRAVKDLAAEVMDAFEGGRSEEVTDHVSAFLQDLQTESFVIRSHRQSGATSVEMALIEFDDAPRTVDISLTGRCNLSCHYCFYSEEMKTRKDLPASEWGLFFQELGGLGVRDVCLSGGEVFVRRDLWELIDRVIQNRMRYSILTNATLITDRTLESLGKGRRRQRLNGVQVSIDGSCPDVHDRSRGSGSFERAIRGLRMLKDAGFPVACRVTVNRYNVCDLHNIARLLLEDIALKSISTNDVMPVGAGCDNRFSTTLLPDQQPIAMKVLADLAKRYKGRVTGMAGPLAKWRMYQEMERARATGEKTGRWKMGYLTACGCVYSKLAVHHDGVITPCNILSGVELGRINADPIVEVWRNHPTLKAIRDRRTIPMTEVPGCGDCEWAPYCNGSCPGLAYEMTGDFNSANPHDCYRRFLAQSGGFAATDTE